MAVRIRKTRNYKRPVLWEVGEEKGKMIALFYLPTEDEFALLPEGEKAPLLELCLKEVEGLELEGQDGELITDFTEVKKIIISDGELSRAFYDAFMEMWAKKTLPATWQMQAQTIMDLLSQSQLTDQPASPKG